MWNHFLKYIVLRIYSFFPVESSRECFYHVGSVIDFDSLHILLKILKLHYSQKLTLIKYLFFFPVESSKGCFSSCWQRCRFLTLSTSCWVFGRLCEEKWVPMTFLPLLSDISPIPSKTLSSALPYSFQLPWHLNAIGLSGTFLFLGNVHLLRKALLGTFLTPFSPFSPVRLRNTMALLISYFCVSISWPSPPSPSCLT